MTCSRWHCGPRRQCVILINKTSFYYLMKEEGCPCSAPHTYCTSIRVSSTSLDDGSSIIR